MYQYANIHYRALHFIRAHESEFLDDPKVAEKILSFYLSANALDDATRISKKILQRLEHHIADSTTHKEKP
jgi:pyrroloquinoline quinone (PQQ) biosynthesis protein C